jgi:hypothetical protein
MMRSLKNRIAFGIKLGLPESQAARLAKLETPEAIQDFVTSIPTNFEEGGDTCLSVTEALRQKRAHCIEGAFVAACALWMQGHTPLLMDYQAKGDDDHVVTLFRRDKCWGAISKSNHVWLRWRDPIHRTLRELAISYFHEYVSGGSKTLWAYSKAFDLRRLKPEEWVTNKDNCWDAADTLDQSRHYQLITATQARRLRARDALELKAGEILEYRAPSEEASARY